MTDDDLKRLRKLHEAASPEPWHVEIDKRTWGWVEVRGPSISVGGPTRAADLSLADEIERKADAALIAEARNALPGLLDELERLRKFEAGWAEAEGKLSDKDEEIARLRAELREARLQAIADGGQVQMMMEERDAWRALAADFASICEVAIGQSRKHLSTYVLAAMRDTFTAYQNMEEADNAIKGTNDE